MLAVFLEIFDPRCYVSSQFASDGAAAVARGRMKYKFAGEGKRDGHRVHPEKKRVSVSAVEMKRKSWDGEVVAFCLAKQGEDHRDAR